MVFTLSYVSNIHCWGGSLLSLFWSLNKWGRVIRQSPRARGGRLTEVTEASLCLLVSSTPAASSICVQAAEMEEIWPWSRKGISGEHWKNGSCAWLLLQCQQSLSLCKSWASHWILGRILDHSLVLILRRQLKGGVCSWKHRLKEKGAGLLPQGNTIPVEDTLLRTSAGSVLSQEHLSPPPFLSFSLELTSAESWVKPSSQQLVFLSNQKPWQSFPHCWQTIKGSAGPLLQPRHHGCLRKLSSDIDSKAVLL